MSGCPDLERRATDGDPEAMVHLGNLEVEVGNHEAAWAWWEKAAAIGSAEAMFNLAQSLREFGAWEPAWSWFERAAALGHEGAQDVVDLGL